MTHGLPGRALNSDHWAVSRCRGPMPERAADCRCRWEDALMTVMIDTAGTAGASAQAEVAGWAAGQRVFIS